MNSIKLKKGKQKINIIIDRHSIASKYIFPIAVSESLKELNDRGLENACLCCNYFTSYKKSKERLYFMFLKTEDYNNDVLENRKDFFEDVYWLSSNTKVENALLWDYNGEIYEDNLKKLFEEQSTGIIVPNKKWAKKLEKKIQERDYDFERVNYKMFFNF